MLVGMSETMKWHPLPRMIIVLGPSGAGKTSFISQLKKCYGIYNVIDDLNPLQEIFHIDNLIYLVNKSRNPKTRSKLLHKYKNLDRELRYTHKIWRGYIKEIKTNRTVKPKYSIPNRSGGYKIINPSVWDEILKLVISDLNPNQKYVLEFSRGKDEDYITAKQISETQVYKYSMKLIRSFLPSSFEKSTLIIHITASYKIRDRRNERRRLKSTHYVSRETMERIYPHDIFQFIPKKPNSNKGWLKLPNTIELLPVYSINNNADLPADRRDSFFLKEFHEALNFFQSFDYG